MLDVLDRPATIAPDRPLSRVEYQQMIARGHFASERVELLRGELVEMSPQGPMHSEVIHRLLEQLIGALAGRARIRVQAPLAVSDRSEPEPDLALVRNRDYGDQHPTDALLVVEVAATSIAIDRDVKAALYAAADIPEYWVIDLNERSIEVYSHPRDGQYWTVSRRRVGDTLQPGALPDIVLSVASIISA